MNIRCTRSCALIPYLVYGGDIEKAVIETENGSKYEIEEGKDGSLSMHSIGAICEQKEIAV